MVGVGAAVGAALVLRCVARPAAFLAWLALQRVLPSSFVAWTVAVAFRGAIYGGAGFLCVWLWTKYLPRAQRAAIIGTVAGYVVVVAPVLAWAFTQVWYLSYCIQVAASTVGVLVGIYLASHRRPPPKDPA